MDVDETIGRYEALLSNVEDGVVLVDAAGVVRYVNGAVVAETGVDREAWIGAPYADHLDDLVETAAARERFDDALSRILAGDADELRFEASLGYRSGGREVADVRMTPYRAEEFDGVVVVVRDVSELKARERDLERYRELVDHLPVGVFRTDVADEGTLVEANPALVSLLGAESESDLVGRRIATFYADSAERPRVIEALREDGVATVETRFETLDGECVWVLATAIKHEDDRGNVFADGVIQDVTDRKTFQRRLEAQNERLETIVSNVPIVLFVLDEDGRFERSEGKGLDALGLDPGELVGRSVFDVYDDHPVIHEAVERALGGEATHATVDLDGLVYETWYQPVLGEGGTVPRVIGVAVDVTRRVETQRLLERQRDQLELLNRLVRHDIRNDMTVVLGFGQLLREEVSDDLLPDVDRILETTRHTVELTTTARDLVETIRADRAFDLEPVDLAATLTDEVANVRRSYPEASVEVAGDLPSVTVRANPLLSAVFRNLLNNAVQHNDEPTPHVEVSVSERDDGVVVAVADDGPGIPDDRKADLFVRGPTDLGAEQTSIGLYLVATLVDGYGGDVWVEDNDPVGSVFYVSLPTAE